jgi:pimeloyl-ACP methyl ester carboxylesterase
MIMKPQELAMKINANGLSMNYEIAGTGESLVLIHGAGGNLNMWYHQVPVFSKSYRVITYDVRGAGETESPEAGYSISLFAKDTCELMKAIGVEEACFVGYSMGGRIAIELAINYPKMVKALVLANSALRRTRPSPETVEGWRTMLGLLDKGDMEKVAEMIAGGAFSPGFESKNPIEFERYREVVLRNKPDGLARIMRSLFTPPASPDLNKVKCPVLLIIGSNDPNVGVEQGEKTHKEIAGSELVILPTGHATAIESPDQFNSAVIEFLSELRQR